VRKSLSIAGGLLVILVAILYFRPVPASVAQPGSIILPSDSPTALPWPSSGQAAFGAVGYGLLERSHTSTPTPIASITKIITALAVLQKKPIVPGTQGDVITLDKSDVDLFNYYYTHNGSVARVGAGEQLTQYQALEAMLLPSANNMADSMAIWAFGSIQSYINYANSMVKEMGLRHTTVGGASGFDDNTTSTADDLVKLGLAALANPTIKQIVQEQKTKLPVAGIINNTNYLLGQNGVVGIKTGNTEKAGGCYLFAAERNISSEKITVVGAILGSANLDDAIRQAAKIIKASDSGFERLIVVRKGESLGKYHTPWGTTADITSSKDISLLTWKGEAVKVESSFRNVEPTAKAGASAGSIQISNSLKTLTEPVILASDLPGPSWQWRIFHL